MLPLANEKDIHTRKSEALYYLEKKKAESVKLAFVGIGATIFCAGLWYLTEMFLFAIITGVLFFGSLCIPVHDIPYYNRKIKSVETELDEIEQMIQKEKQQQKELDEKLEEIDRNAQAHKAAQHAYDHPECPMCKSHNTRRISTANRAISVATVGLASSKIGKQYECFNCKHKW